MNWKVKQKDKMLMFHFNRSAIIRTFILSLLISLALGAFSVAYGSDGTMETLGFDVHIQVEEDNTMLVTETITINYLTPHHGIYRNINFRGVAESEFEGKVYQQRYSNTIKKVKVEGYDFQSYTDYDFYVIQIGSGDYTIEGVHTYEISYRCVLRDDRIPEFDSFYWNLIPYGWDMPINEANVTIEFPSPLELDKVEVISGLYGTTEKSDFLSSSDNRTFYYQGTQLEEGQGVTFRSVMDEGYFKGEATLDWALWALVIGIIIATLLAFFLWIRFGRDPHMVKTVEFYAPEGTTPAEIGYIVDGVVDDKDLVSLVIYLADQGHLSIEQGEKKKDFLLHKKEPLPDGSKLYLRTFYEGLFLDKDGNEIDSVMISDLKDTFYSHFTAAQGELRGYFTLNKGNHIYKKSSIFARGLSILLLIMIPLLTMGLGAIYYGDGAYGLLGLPGIVILIIGYTIISQNYDKRDARKRKTKISLYLVGGILVGIEVFIVGAAAFFYELPVWAIALSFLGFFLTLGLSLVMKRRTDKGVELMGKILGFKQFIKNAEVDRINKLVEEDPSYFYHILPYAYVFDLTDKWAKNFEDISMEPPEWLQTNNLSGNLLGPLLVTDMMRNTTRAMESSVISSASLSDGSKGGSGGSGGGGFSSGGGFGGGGMGGGGGGGW